MKLLTLLQILFEIVAQPEDPHEEHVTEEVLCIHLLRHHFF